MPTNVAPLSPARRAAAAVVLLLLLLVSLGVAQVLVNVYNHPQAAPSRELSFSFRWPAGFHRAASDPSNESPSEVYTGTVGAGQRVMTIVNFPVNNGDDDAASDGGLLRAVATNVLRSIAGTGARVAEKQPSPTLGSSPAIDLLSVSDRGIRFARLRAALIGANFVGVLYWGDTVWTAQDDVNFETTAGKGFLWRSTTKGSRT